MQITEQAKLPRRKPSTMPFIMPDGRPLGVFLMETNHITDPHRRLGKKGRGRTKEPANGWSSSSRLSKTAHEDPQPGVSRDRTDAEHAEHAALEKVGQRRQRRWLNDKLLRDMAPPLTAKDMESLFKPAPFGDTGYVSAFTLAAAPEHAPLWDLFRSVDSDKQNRVLLKWEEHVKELRAEVNNMHHNEGGNIKKAEPALVAATAALQGWAAVGPRGRKALRRAPRGCAEEIEAPILRLVEDSVENEVVLELDDGFQRLLAHSIAKFHSLCAQSRDSLDGGKVVVVRKRRISGEDEQKIPRGKSRSPQRENSSQTPPPPLVAAAGASPNPNNIASLGGSTAPAGSISAVLKTEILYDPTAPRFTCLDILWLLDDDAQHGGYGGLNAKTLRDSLVCHDHASMVEMDHVHSHHQPGVVSPVVLA
jgi:R3H-associated N-terminal domain